MKPDWIKVGKRKRLCEHVVSRNPDCRGIKFEEAGWYQGGGDTFYLADRKGEWIIYYWTQYDPRTQFGDEYVR